MNKNKLIKIVGGIKSEFPNNKLAYLAMTSKVEHQLRDAIANQMHIELQKIKSTSFVCREWKYIDAEILDSSGNPELLIEFKGHSSIDFPDWLLKRKSNNKIDIVKDISGLIDNAIDSTDLYFIFFNNLLKSDKILPKNPIKNKPIAYENLVIKSISGKYEEKVSRVIKNWAYLLKQLNLPPEYTSVVEIDAGIYLGSYPISILTIIYGNFKKNDNFILNSLVCNPNVVNEDFDFARFDQSKFKNIDLNGMHLYSYDLNLLKSIKEIEPNLKCWEIK